MATFKRDDTIKIIQIKFNLCQNRYLYLNILFMRNNGLGMEISKQSLLIALIISLAADSGVTSGNKLGNLK